MDSDLTAMGDSDLRKARAAIPARLLSISVLIAIVFWLIESANHTWLIDGWGTYQDNLFPPNGNEIWMRMVMTVLIVGNGAISASLTRTLIGKERQNLRLKRELSNALLRSLSGIVSICMHCKRVRSHNEQWDAIEKYLAARTDLRFSHGICAACYSAHYPD